MKLITIFLAFVKSTLFSIQLESTQPKLDATNCPANCAQCDQIINVPNAKTLTILLMMDANVSIKL